jgi:hypothetical protein
VSVAGDPCSPYRMKGRLAGLGRSHPGRIPHRAAGSPV